MLQLLLSCFLTAGLPTENALSDFIDRPSWLTTATDFDRKKHWLSQSWTLAPNATTPVKPTRALPLIASRPLPVQRCDSTSDCEDMEALRSFFYEQHQQHKRSKTNGKIRGISLELGGLDGIGLSMTLGLERSLGFRRIIIEADPAHRPKRRADAPSVVGVTAAVCAHAGRVHYIGSGPTAGVAEFMPAEFLRQWYPQLAEAWEAAGKRWSADVFAALGSPQGSGRSGWRPALASQPLAPSVAKTVSSLEVPCVSLTAILDEVQLRWIDFAILDTEGAELAILQTVDWGKVRFGVLVVECNAKTRPPAYRQQVWVIKCMRGDRRRWRLFLSRCPPLSLTVLPHASLPHTSLPHTSKVIDYMLNSTGGQYRIVFPQRGRNAWFMHRSFVATAESMQGMQGMQAGDSHARRSYRWMAPAVLGDGGGAPQQHSSSAVGSAIRSKGPASARAVFPNRRRRGRDPSSDVVTTGVAKTLGGIAPGDLLRKLLLGGLAAACCVAALCAALNLVHWLNLCSEVGR